MNAPFEPASVQVIFEGGQLPIPAELASAIGLEAGDPVIIEVSDRHLIIRRDWETSIRRVQELLRPYRPTEGYVSDELIAERRAEAERE